MAQTEENVLQAMYELTDCKNTNSAEYVVRGATVKCGGSKTTCALNLPKDHASYTADKRPLITINDATSDNVGFGTCDLTGKTCTPSLSKWSYTGGNKKIKDSNTQKDEYTVTKYSTATCTIGEYSADVKFENSGQVIPEYTDKNIEGAIEIVEDVRGSWKRKNDKKDFLGHILICHSGVYNLGVKMENVKYDLGGTVFLYRKAFGISPSTMRFVGAYELYEHKNNIKFTDIEEVLHLEGTTPFIEEMEVNWTIWVDLVLDKDIDYYVEIDLPSKDAYDYKLIGNMDVIPSYGIGFAIWTIDSMHASKHSFNYKDLIPRENNMRIKVCCIYLDRGYMVVVRDILLGEVYQESLSDEAELKNNIRSILLTILSKAVKQLEVAFSIVGWLMTVSDKFKENIIDEINKKTKIKKSIKLTISVIIAGDQEKLQTSFLVEATEWDLTLIKGPKYLLGQFDTQPVVEMLHEYAEFRDNL